MQEIPLKENFIMKNTEIAFYSFKLYLYIYIYIYIFYTIFIDGYLYGYLALHIEGNGDSLEVFRLFSMFPKDKAFK